MAIYKSRFTGEEIDDGVKNGLDYKIVDTSEWGNEVPSQYRDKEKLKKMILMYASGIYRLIFDEIPDLTYSYIFCDDEGNIYSNFIYINTDDWSFYTDELVYNFTRSNVKSNVSLPINNIVVGQGGLTVKDSNVSINDLVLLKKTPKLTLKCSNYDIDTYISVLKNALTAGTVVRVKWGSNFCWGIVTGDETQGGGTQIQTITEYRSGTTQMLAWEIDVNPDIGNIVINGIRPTSLALINSNIDEDYNSTLTFEIY